jgi:hypothetical protein
MSSVLFIITQLFTIVYLGLGIATLSMPNFFPWLPFWGRLLFGIACILYASLRFYRSYIIWKESQL